MNPDESVATVVDKAGCLIKDAIRQILACERWHCAEAAVQALRLAFFTQGLTQDQIIDLVHRSVRDRKGS